jgi:hypothetical protein
MLQNADPAEAVLANGITPRGQPLASLDFELDFKNRK